MKRDTKIANAVEEWFKHNAFGDWEKAKNAIADANSNLYCGPTEDQKMGFEEATDFLSDWADDYVEKLYYDEQFEGVSDTPPADTEECFECNGTGLPDSADEGTEWEKEECDICNGTGEVESMEWEFVTVLDEAEVKRRLFGKELAQYIK